MNRFDSVLSAFLEGQRREAEALAAESDLLELMPEPTFDEPPARYLVRFHCNGLIRDAATGAVEEADRFDVRIAFPDHYLRRVAPPDLVMLIDPPNVFHPNVRAPFLCLGRIAPGTAISDLLFQVFDILTFQKVTMREDDALNHLACAWAREHRERFPIDPRPLKWRAPEAVGGK